MLCKKCGKEINNNVHCPYCKCDNHYEHENVPAHLTFIQALFDSPLSADAAVRMNAGQREDANCPAQGRFERPEQRPMPADALGTRANSGAVYDDLDEEMDEMIR